MKSAKQNYITIGSDGTVLPQGKPRKAAEPVGESADVAYRLARMAEEAAASLPIAPNAHDAADAADYTAVPRALATAAPRTPKGAGGIDAGSKPVALVMARPKTAKRLMQAVGDAGFAACAVYTQDHRGDSHIKLAQSAVSLGEKYSDALFCNGHAVLTAIDSCGASVVLLCDEALPLAEVDSFLARTAARGVRVFRPLSNDAPLLGWVLCTTDKPAIDGDSWRACPHCGLKFDGPSLAAGHYVCPACGGYLRMSSSERIDDLLDADSFVEWNRTVPETDPLEFPGYLGKSVQLIAFLLARQSEARAVGPSLIVCPASLVYNWMAEFERFAPTLDVRAAVGAKRERMRIRAEACERDARESELARDGRCCDVLITSYDLLRIDAEDFARREFYCCALDEAQYVKNHATKTARAAKRVRARHRFALTGTPMENRLSELWSIFDFLMPGLLGSYMRFREHFELDITGGDEDAARRLRSLVAPFMLRRLKADVLQDLPDKLESVVYVPMEAEQQRLYAAHEQQLRDALTLQKNNRNNKQFHERKVEVLAELTKLRQLCCDPRLLYENYAGHAAKLDAIAEIVESAMDAGEKTLVFSQFTSFLSLIAEVLDAHGVPYFTITGTTPKKRRLDLVNAFNDDDTPVFLVSLKAGGTGLNLTGASVVVHADPWWNAAAQNQATDRAHRIGQTQVVSVHKVIAKDTVEERILHLQDAKTDLADQVIGAGGVSLASLSQEELLDLLDG